MPQGESSERLIGEVDFDETDPYLFLGDQYCLKLLEDVYKKNEELAYSDAIISESMKKESAPDGKVTTLENGDKV